jgi:hypothetical protein
MTVTARSFSDSLRAAIVAEKPLRLTLVSGRRHRVLLPVSIMENEVAFAGPYFINERVVVTWNEIVSLEIGSEGPAPQDRVVAINDRLTVLLLKAGLSAESSEQLASLDEEDWRRRQQTA